MTVVNPKSISGITSITTASGGDDILTIHNNNGTERLRIDSTGTTKIVTGIVTTLTATTGIVTTLTTNTLTANSTAKVGSGVTLSPDGDVFVTGVTTSSTVKVGGGVTISESGIEASGIGITCANINGGAISGRRNLIINGAMQVNRHSDSNAGVDGTFAVDRSKFQRENTSANFSMTQSTTSPDGFSKSLKVDCTSADTSTASNEFVLLSYSIEAQDLQQLGYGTASAKPLVLSFYVRSNLTGTYGLSCIQPDNSNKIYGRSYTINSADTWERKTISIPADTSGVINDDTGVGFKISFGLTMGSTYTSGSVSTAWETYSNSKFAPQHAVNVGGNTSNEWYLTGLQLELGSQATAFEHRSFSEELVLCQRYYQQIPQNPADNYGPIAMGRASSATNAHVMFSFPEMRSSPTIAKTGDMRLLHKSEAATVSSITTPHTARTTAFIEVQVPSSLVQGQGCTLTANNDGDAKITLTSEL